MFHELGMGRRMFASGLVNALNGARNKNTADKTKELDPLSKEFIKKGEALSGVEKSSCNVSEAKENAAS